MVAARLGCERAVVRTGWATSHTDCMDRLRKHHSHLIYTGLVLAKKAAWALYDIQRYWAIVLILVNEWTGSKSRVCILRLEGDMGRGYGALEYAKIGLKWKKFRV